MLPPPEAVSSPSGFKDRKVGLAIFGILTVLIGGFFALMVPLMIWGMSLSTKPGVAQNMRLMVPGMVMYGGLAVVLVWLGIGSIMARRWARALLLIFSWSWLSVGVTWAGIMAFVLPRVLKTLMQVRQDLAVTPGADAPELHNTVNNFNQGFAAVIVMNVVAVIVFLLLPAVWVFFYRSKHVKATCERCDPVIRWTDRCPLPVIALSLWLVFSSAMMLLSTVTIEGVMPVFGILVTGPMGSALNFVIALLWGYSAWAMYKLDRRGWWVIVICFCLFAISAFITYSRHDLGEIYATMGLPKDQTAEMQKLDFFKGQKMAWFTLLCMLPFFGYLVWVRKFFTPRLEVDSRTDAS